MLEILTLAVLAVIVLILILVFKLLKHFFKIFALVVLVLIIISTVASYFIYQDVMDLKENFDKNDNLFILHQNDKLFTGLSLKFDELLSGLAVFIYRGC